MMTKKQLLLDAYADIYFGKPPYHVEIYPVGSSVNNQQGFNCLRFKSKPGAVFTSLEIANLICAMWNKNLERDK